MEPARAPCAWVESAQARESTFWHPHFRIAGVTAETDGGAICCSRAQEGKHPAFPLHTQPTRPRIGRDPLIRSPVSCKGPASWSILHPQSGFSCMHSLESGVPYPVWTIQLTGGLGLQVDALHPNWAFSNAVLFLTLYIARILSFFIVEMD